MQFSDSDNYTMSFPRDASPVQKAVLAVVATCVDMLFFENNGNQNNNNSGGLLGNIIGAALS